MQILVIKLDCRLNQGKTANVRALLDTLKDKQQSLPVYIDSGTGIYPLNLRQVRVDERDNSNKR